MSNTSLAVSFKIQSEETTDSGLTRGDWLKLEQKELEDRATGNFWAWAESTYGAQAVNSANWGTLMRWFEQYQAYCDEEEFEAEIYAHKAYREMRYRLDASKGRWKNQTPQIRTERDLHVLNITGQSSYTFTSLNVISLVCAQWEGNVYDIYGNPLSPKPTVTPNWNPIEDDQLNAGALVMSFTRDGQPVKAIGTLRTVVEIEYDVWWLILSPNILTGDEVSTGSQISGTGIGANTGGYGSEECLDVYDQDDIAGAYASTVRGIYSGGMQQLEVRAPDLKQQCDETFRTDVEIDPCYELEIVYHKCSGEVLEENFTQVECPED